MEALCLPYGFPKVKPFYICVEDVKTCPWLHILYTTSKRTTKQAQEFVVLEIIVCHDQAIGAMLSLLHYRLVFISIVNVVGWIC